MEVKQAVLLTEIVGHICDMCTQTCRKNSEEGYEYGTLSAEWGYWSDQRDLTQEECHLCESCFAKVREFIQSQGGKVRQMQLVIQGGPVLRKKRGVDYIVEG